MIGTIRHRGLKRLYERDDKSGLQQSQVTRITSILTALEAANIPEELDLPGYRLHRLRGQLQGFWSVRVSGNWRIIFRFENGKALDVDLVDYH